MCDFHVCVLLCVLQHPSVYDTKKLVQSKFAHLDYVSSYFERCEVHPDFFCLHLTLLFDTQVCVLPKTKSLALTYRWLMSMDAVSCKTSRERTLKWLSDCFHNLLLASRAVTNDYFLREVIC